MEATVRFKGWTPSPRAVVVGMERDNKVFTLRFEGLPVYPGGTAYLHIDLGSAGADSIEIVDGLAEITRNITQYEGEKTAYVETIANNDVVWHSDQMLIYVNPLPLVSGKIEQAYPTAFEQALAQTAVDKAAAAKSAAEAAATAAEIVTEEAARQGAESKRVAAETARGKAEETRAEHERLRENAESKRVKAENARETAEANREQAEAAREKDTAAAVKRTDDLVKSVEAKLENGDFIGAQGPQGPQGPIGATGPQGVPGVQGEKGEKGEKGDTGATGPQGEKGADGADGAPGQDGKDGLDAPQIDDTTVSDAAPWSSQHIVDMLCPPLEESGNPVVCYPVAGSKLGVMANWEPTQEGSGEPYPAGGGKNKLPFPSDSTKYPQSRNGLTATANADGSYTINGTATADTWFNICSLYGKGFDDFGAFALSGCPKGGSTSTAYYLALYTGTKWYSETGDGVTGQIDTLAEEARIEISIKDGYVATNLRVWPQLEHGSTVTAYAPYANIRPIHGRDSVKLERCGENLINYADLFFVNSATPITVGKDKIIMVDNSGWGSTHCYFSQVLPSGTYYMHLKSKGDRPANIFLARGYNFDGTIVEKSVSSGFDYNAFYKGTIVGGANNVIKVTLTGACYYRIGVKCGDGTVEYSDIGVYTTAPAEYAPYSGSTTTLTLPSTIYGADMQVDGAGQATWAKQTFDGTEKWNQRTASGYFSYSLGLPTRAQTGICSHYKRLLYEAIRPNNPTGETGCYLENSASAIFNVPFETLADWTAFLAAQYAAGTPAQVAYKLVAPVPFSATGGGTIKALSGINTILTDTDALTVKGRADPIHIIQQLQAASAASAQALADVERAVTDI